jgi:zinc transport system permease protein
MSAFFEYDFLQRALIAAAVVGLTAPLVGVFLVQRRLALLGDGMGHVALTGIGLALLLNTAPLPTAMIAAASGAVIVELIRSRSRTAGDLALALVFYGGIAGGVVLASFAGAGSANLTQYLFGAITTVSAEDLRALLMLALLILVTLVIAGRSIWLMSLDAEVARVQGVRVGVASILLTVLAAVVVVVGMRVVGILLVSALMIVPVAAAQQLTRSFRATLIGGAAIGLTSAVLGLGVSYALDVAPGAMIVVMALGLFVLSAVAAIPVRRWQRARAAASLRAADLQGAPA